MNVPPSEREAALLSALSETEESLAAGDIPRANERLEEVGRLAQRALATREGATPAVVEQALARFDACVARAKTLQAVLEQRLADSGTSTRAVLAYRRRYASWR